MVPLVTGKFLPRIESKQATNDTVEHTVAISIASYKEHHVLPVAKEVPAIFEMIKLHTL